MLVKFQNDFYIEGHLFRHRDGLQEVPDKFGDRLPSSAMVEGVTVKDRKVQMQEAAAKARAARVAKNQEKANSVGKEKVEDNEKVADPSVPVQTEGQS